MNKLADESSPYLLQHRDNPVHWYPWGPEAFEAAAAADKPVFISIGYAACHWCHVMAHESFENADIAALMNELFVSVKVDREERPEVDQIYMTALQATGQGGGWPLSAFCTPDGKPFFLGTYFPPVDRRGQPSFPRVLQRVAELFRDQRQEVERNTAAIVDALGKLDDHYRGHDGAGEVGLELLVAAGRTLCQRSDPLHGGFGTRPKFPSSSAHELLARCGRLRGGEPAKEAFLAQCQAMARGGIYDQLGGGFSRYSVDERWRVPHFEKMLYDNAQLLGVYGDAYAMTGDAGYARVIGDTVAWLRREMQHDSGGLYASQDADSAGEEGTFYVWTPDQVVQILGAVPGDKFCAAYGVTAEGNFEHSTTVLSLVADEPLPGLCDQLFAARASRVPPETDTKILAGWNGLAVTGLVRAWQATGQADALAMAEQVAGFLVEQMLHSEGTRLHRVFKAGQTRLEGTLDDYAFCAEAFLNLAEATEDSVWWRRGCVLLDTILARFYQEVDGLGVFFLSAEGTDGQLIHRPESHHDGAIPAGAAVTVDALIHRGLIAREERGLEIAERYLARRAPGGEPFAVARLLVAADRLLHGGELVVSEGAGREELLGAARAAYAPTIMLAGSWAAPSLRQDKKSACDGTAQAYLCRGHSCSAPVSTAAELQKLLQR